MQDLILSINAQESVKNKSIVIDTFLGKNKYTKKGYFSGPLKKVDIFELDRCHNFSHAELEKFRWLWKENEGAHIKRHQLCINIEAFQTLYNKIASKHCVYWFGKEKKYINIDQVSMSLKKLSETSEKFDCGLFILYFNFDRKSIMIYTESQVHQLIPREKVILHTIPQPIFMLEKKESKIQGQLYLLYGKTQIPLNAKDTVIEGSEKWFYRNVEAEKEYIEKLKMSGFNKDYMNVFTFHFKNKLLKGVNYLIDQGFKVYYFDGKPVISSKSSQYHISYDVDWFSIDASTTINEVEYKLSEYMNLKSNKGFVEINNHIVLLPNDIVEHRKEFQLVDGKIRLPKNKLITALELSKNKILNLNRFIDFASVKVEMPQKINSLLRPYQQVGVQWLKWLYVNNLGGCLADDMGLGSAKRSHISVV